MTWVGLHDVWFWTRSIESNIMSSNASILARGASSPKRSSQGLQKCI